MDKYTFGNSKAAVNLITTLERPEYNIHSEKIRKLLSKQLKHLKAVTSIKQKETRETTLKMWHDRFRDRVNATDIPEVLKTHTLCVAVGKYRQYLKESQKGINNTP